MSYNSPARLFFFLRNRRENVAQAAGVPNRETKEARGEGSCTGPVEVNRGPT
jgi:hypothetical protein